MGNWLAVLAIRRLARRRPPDRLLD